MLFVRLHLNLILAESQDTLLPKLISGELRVAEVMEMMEEDEEE